MPPTLVWFRRDLRLQDNPALQAAQVRGGAIVPVYLLDEPAERPWAPGGASRRWLHQSLAALDRALRARGSRLILARGDPAAALPVLLTATGGDAVYWNRRYEPAGIAADARVEAALRRVGTEVRTFNAALLYEPSTVTNREGRPFQVFTPYWRHCLARAVPPPGRLRAGPLPSPDRWPDSLPALPPVEAAPRFDPAWEPGEAGAARRLRRFCTHGLERYADERDRPAVDGTSLLSAHLHFGEVGPRQVWAAVQAPGRASGVFPPHRGAAAFLAELGWREFAHHLLFHFPDTPGRPLRARFTAFPWAADPGGAKLRAWRHGETGYPIVDAGLRQLRQTGWMHNRVRMITASFLVKHLRLPWTEGAAWFRRMLADADLANNTLGWQWSAGCGADAAPYFRIFAPVLQGRKFDPEGAYVRRWLPELAGLPAAHVHAPWEASAAELDSAGVRLGRDYPPPIVDHASARAEALRAFRQFGADAPG